jgi:hypothetical protein
MTTVKLMTKDWLNERQCDRETDDRQIQREREREMEMEIEKREKDI